LTKILNADKELITEKLKVKIGNLSTFGLDVPTPIMLIHD